MAINNLKAAPGISPDFTLWTSLADLAKHVFYFKNYAAAAFLTKDGPVVALAPDASKPDKYDIIKLDELTSDHLLPPNVVAIRVTRKTPYVDPSQVIRQEGVKVGTPYNFRFVPIEAFTPEFIKNNLYLK